MPECDHQFEKEGLIRERDAKGLEKVVRSYRCQRCGAICTDRNKAAMMAAPVAGKPTGPKKEEVKMTEKIKRAEKTEKPETTGRLARALADGWEQGKTYRRIVKRRKDGKTFICTMTVQKGGFKDQTGKIWPAPTALTTNFMHVVVGVAGRRPAKSFFADAPKPKSIATRPDAKGSGKPAKAAPKAPTKAVAPKAPAKAAAPKAPTKAPAKAVKPAPAKKLAAVKTAPAPTATAELPDDLDLG